jgi:peptidoglycan hydrolase CwlO-like protein
MTPKIPKNRNNDKKRATMAIERGAQVATRWIGSTKSLVAHSILFLFFFSLVIFGIKVDTVMLILTTIVSLEAIYLSIFIQMSVNHHAYKLEEVSEDIEDIQEDMGEIQKDVGEISEDVEEIGRDIEEISEDVEGIEKDIDEIQKDVDEIQEDVGEISEDVEEIGRDIEEINEEDEINENIKHENIALSRIEDTLTKLIKEINELKKKQK